MVLGELPLNSPPLLIGFVLLFGDPKSPLDCVVGVPNKPLVLPVLPPVELPNNPVVFKPVFAEPNSPPPTWFVTVVFPKSPVLVLGVTFADVPNNPPPV